MKTIKIWNETGIKGLYVATEMNCFENEKEEIEATKKDIILSEERIKELEKELFEVENNLTKYTKNWKSRKIKELKWDIKHLKHHVIFSKNNIKELEKRG